MLYLSLQTGCVVATIFVYLAECVCSVSAVSYFAESLLKEEKRKHREASENLASERGASLEFHEPAGEQPEGQNNQSRDSRGGNSADTTLNGSPHGIGTNYQLSSQERPLMQ
ncbi:uncharacterized protein N7458_011102 [Penicillium daleae]|uniref:Uncharacterized protein n=1 Tax=Penicillium daleae TaxID=63821 RepID=A0AAD6C084_9EURO|nr:uncharacterized protein N7458_011102 [Penicillium daleae]KAJ5440104.1 hypothetical protein N7458_011102 [Penicillium daleae]